MAQSFAQNQGGLGYYEKNFNRSQKKPFIEVLLMISFKDSESCNKLLKYSNNDNPNPLFRSLAYSRIITAASSLGSFTFDELSLFLSDKDFGINPVRLLDYLKILEESDIIELVGVKEWRVLCSQFSEGELKNNGKRNKRKY